MASEAIGCSLAEAAESESYTRYLEAAADQPDPGLHVVYINTSLRTKALAHALVPTITCTSSNVVQTVLQVRRTALYCLAMHAVWHLKRPCTCPGAHHNLHILQRGADRAGAFCTASQYMLPCMRIPLP